ncbi:MAG: ComEC family competence protein, partial [Desulfobulbaceae bacterium]|nr:ComEC family competence protein [Desulfobulbaceae bacterium]
AGIGLTNVRYVPSGPAAWILVAALSLAILALHLKQIPFIASILTLPLFFLIGSLHVRPFLDLPDNPLHIYSQIEERQEVSLTGILMESPAVGPKKSRLLMRVERLTHPGGTTDSTGLVQLSLNGNPPPDLIPGDRFMARAILSRVRSNTTPGTFDLKQFLALKSILVTGWIRSPCLLTEIHDLNPSPLFHRIRFSPERARKKINDFLANTADERVMGLYKAILTGDRSGVPPDQLENFRTAGCVHLLAISGLHMGLLALFITFSITWLLKRSEWLLLHIPALKTAAFLALPFLASYALIAGFQTPVVRALIMTSVFVMALLFDSQWSIPTNIAIAALIILTLNPTCLYTVSFQLSFAAVIAIALIVPAISGLLYPFSHGENDKSPKSARIKKWALASICLSIAAMLGTMPLLMYNFNRFSPVSPVSTLIVEPLLCFWALIIGLLASPLIPLFPQIAACLIKIGCWGLLAADKTAELLADLPFSSVWVSTPTAPEVVCCYIFLASLALLKKTRAASIVTILSLV